MTQSKNTPRRCSVFDEVEWEALPEEIKELAAVVYGGYPQQVQEKTVHDIEDKVYNIVEEALSSAIETLRYEVRYDIERSIKRLLQEGR